MTLDVLVVDDSPVTRRMISRALGMCGVPLGEVLEAGDGAEALGLLSRRRVDLVLADVNMPVMSGTELVERMSRDERLAQIPVVVVASPTCEDRVSRLLDCGVRGFLPKPFRPEALREVVRDVLSRGGAR